MNGEIIGGYVPIGRHNSIRPFRSVARDISLGQVNCKRLFVQNITIVSLALVRDYAGSVDTH